MKSATESEMKSCVQCCFPVVKSTCESTVAELAVASFSVELVFEGPEGINLVRKAGFNNGKSTGPSLYREYFPKGSYKITANLTQIEGGTYSFKKLTQAQ